MDTMKSAVGRVSEVVFPGIKVAYKQSVIRRRDEIISSLPLQMCLYFNVNYSPLWFIIRVGCLIYKFADLIQLYRILLIAIMTVMFLIEISRLYLGYAGNLQEKAFFMLCLKQGSKCTGANRNDVPVHEIVTNIALICKSMENIVPVPELTGFWMLTTFLQFPLHSLCTFSQDFIVLPWERVVDVIFMIFIVFEIIIGYAAVKKISNHQALKMKMQLLKYNTTNRSTETFVE